jgi:hypothetical protein
MVYKRMANWNNPVHVYWCLHCERIQRRSDGGAGDCAFSDCDGGAWDLWTWKDFRDQGGLPEGWPSRPPHDGAWLPMYPPDGWRWYR